MRTSYRHPSRGRRNVALPGSALPRFSLPLLGALLLAACGADAPPPPPAAPGEVAIEPWALPALPGSAQPDLKTAPDGRLLLSWINTDVGRRPALQFGEFYLDDHWEGPRTVAVGRAMFVNWADTPHIAATPDRALWAHWLQKSADAPYAYDVMLVRSLNHGANWSDPVRVHDDGTTTEHGFVSMWAQGDDRLGVAWLDGRRTVGSHDGHGDGKPADGEDRDGEDHGSGAMTLRAAVFDANLQASAEFELDASACDCCQTDVAATGDGAVLVYRDRTEAEIRDIYAVRFDGERWSKPQRVHADEWKMPACPVNGPAVAARDRDVVTAWYTGAGDVPSVKLARATDGGARFAAPVLVDEGVAVLGRVDVALDARQVWLLWMREEGGVQSLWLARYAPDLSRRLQKTELARLQGKGRATGFPRLTLRGDDAYVVWTDIFDGKPRLQGAILRGASGSSPGNSPGKSP